MKHGCFASLLSRTVASVKPTCCAVVTRLWRSQLEQSYPFWTSAGIRPVQGRKDGETWKQLVSTALSEIVCEPPAVSAATPAISRKAKEFWNKGQALIQGVATAD